MGNSFLCVKAAKPLGLKEQSDCKPQQAETFLVFNKPECYMSLHTFPHEGKALTFRTNTAAAVSIEGEMTRNKTQRCGTSKAASSSAC